MVIAEVTIAVLLGIIVVISAIYITYFSYTTFKLNKGRIANGESELVNFNKRGKILSIVLAVYFAISLGMFATNIVYRTAPQMKDQYYISINSNSMSKALEGNVYLKNNNLTNQIAQYNIAVFNKVEDPTTLEQFDIILFKQENKLIVHRIIEIDSYGNFITQGDNNKQADDWVVDKNSVMGVYQKSLVFMSFVNYLTYTPGFYVAMIGATYILGTLIVFEIINAKLAKQIKEETTSGS